MTAGERPRRRRATLLWGVATLLWVAFVWGHSLVQGPQSSIESGAVVELVRPVFHAVGVTEVDVMTLIVRKGAHFSEYAVLGVLASGLLRALRAERGVRELPLGLAFALVPVADECLQLLVPGRSGRATDVLIDLSGMLFGALVSWLVRRLSRDR